MYISYHGIHHRFSISPRVKAKGVSGLCRVLGCLARCVAPYLFPGVGSTSLLSVLTTPDRLLSAGLWICSSLCAESS